MKKQPLVSIIIPVYNGSNYMREAIDSALAQTYENIEVIVVNDGSNDDGKTENIALSYGDRIRYIKKENGGVSTALNLGISVMRGEYFSWLSHDDKYSPEKIEKQVGILKKHQDNNLIALCADRQINSNSKFTDAGAKHRFKNEQIVDWPEVVMSLLREGTFNGCALLIPRHIFDECGSFDTALRYNQDAKMWFNIFLKRKKIIYQTDVLVMNRIHSAQVTQTRKDLYHTDCEKMSLDLMPRLIELSSRKYNFLNAYALYNAKYDNRSVVESCLRSGKMLGLFSRKQKIKIRLTALYGRIRPTIRKIYYLFFKRVVVKTK